MIDLNKYGDEVVLSTREVAEWLGCGVSHVLCMGMTPLPMRRRQNHYTAAEVRRAILGERARRGEPTRRGHLQVRSGSR